MEIHLSIFSVEYICKQSSLLCLRKGLAIEAVEIHLRLNLPEVPSKQEILLLIIANHQLKPNGSHVPVGIIKPKIEEGEHFILLQNLQPLHIASHSHLQTLIVFPIPLKQPLEKMTAPSRFAVEKLDDPLNDHPRVHKSGILLQSLNYSEHLVVERAAFERGRDFLAEIIAAHSQIVEGEHVEAVEVFVGEEEGVDGDALLHRQADLLVAQPIDYLLD
jgi:hypothetical protein